MPSPISLLTRLALAAAPLVLTACLANDDGKKDAALPDAAYVFAITSDYKTGAYSAYGLTSDTRLKAIEAIHSDAVVRYHGGSDIFVIDRQGRDNLLVVDRSNLKVVLPVKFPELSNPQDLEAKDGVLYVCFYALDSVLIYDQQSGSRLGAIDIHAYANSNGFAEAVALRFAGNDLYALLQDYDLKNYKPFPDPKLLKLDLQKRAVAKAITLPLTNPQGLVFDSAAGKMYIPCTGEYTDEKGAPKLDGGIVAVDLASGTPAVFATEEELGGNVGRLALHDGKLIADLGLAKSERVEAFPLSDKSSVTPIADLEAYALGGLAVDAAGNTLCVGDRKKGLRLFRLDTFKEKDTTAIDLGLPISDLAVIR